MRFFLLLLLLSSFATLHSQVSGRVVDEQGEASPFTSIYVQNTSTGTLSNLEGFYSLELDAGTYTLVFDRIGFAQQIMEVEVAASPVQLNVTMVEQPIELPGVEITGDGEDPAYAIIRKAMEKRVYFRDVIPEFRCSVYIKGMIKLLEAPEQILGQDVGDMDGMIDSTGQGIIYLSESESILNYQSPERYKEVMISSKVSGDDNGFSFNNARDMDFSLYRNFSTFPRQIISPIASGAFNYYNFRLESSYYDEAGYLINKIELLPKREEDPVYRGYIYIVEDLWNLESVDVYLTGEAMNEPIFDTIYITQQYVPIEEPDSWALFSQTFRFRGGFLGFVLGGQFVGVYADYDLQPAFPPRFFDGEILRVEEGANEVTQEYFEEVRPIPLTPEEAVDYQRKDSIFEIRNSRVYLDSLDRAGNRFQPVHLLTGYSWQDRYHRTQWSVSSPFSALQFNTVQGISGRLNVRYRKDFDEQATRRLDAGGEVGYGFSNEMWWSNYELSYLFNKIQYTRLQLSGGSRISQFNAENPISPTNNEFYSLYFRRNYMKLFREGFLEANLRHEILNGLRGWLQVGWYDRSALTNQEDYSLIKWEERAYTSNDPLNPENTSPAFAANQALILKITLRYRPGQQYLSYPNQRFSTGSDWPDFYVNYTKGIPVGSISTVNFDRLVFGIVERGQTLGLVGEVSWKAEAGYFPNQEQLLLMDYQHFLGNQTGFGNPVDYLDRFQLMPYYSFSTIDPWLELHLQHHFNGFLIDRIPLLNKTGIHTVIGASFLQQWPEGSNFTPYWELSLGFDDLGWKAFRFFRLDGIVSFSGNDYLNWGVVLGVKLPDLN
jgi:hypothetical protein